MNQKKKEIIKPVKKALIKKRTNSSENLRLEGLVSSLSKTRDNLELEVSVQTDELKIRNQELKRNESKQRITEEQLHIRTKAMESATDGIFLLDALHPDFIIIYANLSFQKMTGYAKRDIFGQSFFIFKGAFADGHMMDEIKITLQQGKSFHSEMLSVKKNRDKYWNFLRITPVRDAKGIVTHFIGIKTDITLMRQKNMEIEEQREELLHVTRVGKLAEFVSSLAHEISQPLTAMLSFAQAADRMLKDREPQIKEILQYIIKDNQRAAEVIRRLRSLLKKGKPVLDEIDINNLINETVLLITTDVTVRNKTITVELEKNLPRILGDQIQLQQVLLNLISNSLEAMDDITNARELVVHTSRKDTNTILVSVKDCGCGIPEKNFNKLFTHFYTSKPDGLGMGLSISRSIVEAHGGRLDAVNNPDRGATFYFTLPVVTHAKT